MRFKRRHVSRRHRRPSSRTRTGTPGDPGHAVSPATIDDLRQRLRALGYLDARVDRFVLASAARAHRPASIAVRASLRIGVIAAALLGPAAAIGLVTRMPGLVTGARDAAIVAVYVGVFFGFTVGALAFAAALAASWLTARSTGDEAQFVRRARLLALGAGVVVSVGCLAYLTLWWRTASPGAAWSSPVWTAFALAVATAISVLLGHAVTVTALALTIAHRGPNVPAARVPGASWKTSLAGGAIAFTGAAILLFAAARGDASLDRAPVPLVVKSSAPVVVLAIDGFDPQLHERLRPAPDAPDGSSAAPAASPSLFPVLDSVRVDLSPTDSRDPARLWTTIATGVRPETHGVDALETRSVAGLQGRMPGSTGRVIAAATDVLRLTRPAIASNFERRVKALWEIADQAGLRTAVVNWWATWPVAASSGIVLSDRAVIRLERGGPLDAELGPPDLYQPLQARWPELRDRARQHAQSFFSATRGGDTRDILTRSGELDVSMLRLAEAIGPERRLDLLVVYLPGLDIAQHALLGASAPSASELNLRLAALQQYYVFLESLAGSAAMTSSRDGKRVFVVTQTGRLHSGTGMMAALGPGFQPGTRTQATVLDVTPTILHSLGIPIAHDLDGHVVDSVFEPPFLAANPVRFVDSYGVRGTVSASRGVAPLDQEAIDRLRSLGYVR